MIPVIQGLAEAEGLSEAQTRPLWWSLALGADFGGNLTLIGASANVVVAGMSERAGQRISFFRFLTYGIPVTLLTLAIATIYVLVRYYSYPPEMLRRQVTVQQVGDSNTSAIDTTLTPSGAQHGATRGKLGKESGLSIRDLQPRASPCNA
jgi:di/tricarboxylate transporter